ncbi:PilN domain-containing protein [Orenia marismortui]|uniref:PilN domain-containing protein n=1 Tax=Orenia marismortui TaxID=46469 RepID=UPI00036BF69D|nr:PilN domain-containing protein [Orenia marismortui]
MINLLPPEYQESSGLTQPVTFFISITLIATIIITMAIFYSDVYYADKIASQKLIIVQRELSRLNSKTKNLKSLKAKKDKLENSLASRDDVLGESIYWPAILNEFRDILTKSSWVREVSVSKDRELKILGYTTNKKELKFIIDNLRNSIFFSNINIEVARQEKITYPNYKESEGFYYSLVGKINKKDVIEKKLIDKGDNNGAQ